ncbi:MAG: hypothetical protein P4L59_17900 [Desulfosporosinus sp.]|nr:hypothetical protein [Desulfosporosinus sp.]
MLNKLNLLMEKLNQDPAFKKEGFGEYLTGTMTLGFGENQYTLAFYKGTILEVFKGIPLTGIDIAVIGPEEGWQKFYEHKNFYRAINPHHGKLSLQGNYIRAQTNINCLEYLCTKLCEL